MLANLLELAQEEAPKSFRVIGAELGYRYAGSPVICDEPGGPAPNIEDYEPTSWPGARLPHVWLKPGEVSVHDRIGDGYTLLRLGRGQRGCIGFAKGLQRDRRAVCRCSISTAKPRGASMASTICSSGRICMWSGAAMHCPKIRTKLRVSSPGTEVAGREVIRADGGALRSRVAMSAVAPASAHVLHSRRIGGAAEHAGYA